MKQNTIKYFLIGMFVHFGFVLLAQRVKHPEPQNTIKFTENKNQWGGNVLFRAQLDGGLLFLEKNSFTYNFYDSETLRKNHVQKEKDLPKLKEKAKTEEEKNMSEENFEEKDIEITLI